MSSNIVGYEKVALNAGYNMIGIQFNQVGGESLGLSDSGVLDNSMSGFDEDGNYASMMQIWNGNGYDFYGWSGSSGTEYLEDASLDNKWLNLDYEEEANTAPSGSGYWVKAEKAGTITISGEVPTAASVSTDLVAGYNMVANPYPAAVAVSDFGVLGAGYAGFDEDGNYASMMQIWNGNGYDFYGWSGSSGTEYLEDASLDNKWLNLDYEAVDTPIPYGTAVWIKAEKAGTITFSNPAE